MAEKIYMGSDGVRVRIFGYGEALAALAPAPAPSPAPVSAVVPITLSATTPVVITGAVNGKSYLGVAVDEAEIDVSGAGTRVGEEFSIVLTNVVGAKDIHIRESTTAPTKTVALAVNCNRAVLTFVTTGSGVTVMTAQALNLEPL